MENDEFLRWCETQEDSYELVDGVPVLKYWNGPEMMAGGTTRHADVIGNLYTALRARLRGGPCKAYMGDHLAVRTGIRRERRPDVYIDCQRARPTDLNAAAPTILFEVLSPSSDKDDLVRKPIEYKRLLSARQYIVVDPTTILVKTWTRIEGDHWSEELIDDLTASLDLAVGITLPMTEIYEDIELDPEPDRSPPSY